MNAIPRPVLTLRRARPTEPTVPAAVSTAAPPAIKQPTSAQAAMAESKLVSTEKYWFVWAVGGPAPRRRHGSLKSALAEGRRLRQLVPERADIFKVYQAALVEEDPA
jgi:hypothetical protein